MAGERERLVKVLHGIRDLTRDDCIRAADMLEADAAELAALRKDAERYRIARKKLMLDVGDEAQLDNAIAALASPRNEAKDKGEGCG